MPRPPDPNPDPPREVLEQRWLELTRVRLPGVARARNWPITADHCFQRILLDHAVGGRWYDHVAGRPAYRHIACARLADAVRLGEAALAGDADMAALNARSLAWRRAAKRLDTDAGAPGPEAPIHGVCGRPATSS